MKSLSIWSLASVYQNSATAIRLSTYTEGVAHIQNDAIIMCRFKQCKLMPSFCVEKFKRYLYLGLEQRTAPRRRKVGVAPEVTWNVGGASDHFDTWVGLCSLHALKLLALQSTANVEAWNRGRWGWP